MTLVENGRRICGSFLSNEVIVLPCCGRRIHKSCLQDWNDGQKKSFFKSLRKYQQERNPTDPNRKEYLKKTITVFSIRHLGERVRTYCWNKSRDTLLPAIIKWNLQRPAVLGCPENTTNLSNARRYNDIKIIRIRRLTRSLQGSL